MTRRAVLAGAGGLTLGFMLGVPAGRSFGMRADVGINAYVRIDRRGVVTIFAPVPEMGQGTNTAIPLVIAEELDADWSKVVVETAPVADAFNHPIFRSQYAIGSMSTQGYWMAARMAGAQARRLLIEVVAKQWGVDASKLVTEPGIVVHAASGRRMSYAEVASLASTPFRLPEVKPTDLKAPDAFRLIGKDVARWDVPAKSTGAAVYAIDVRIPEMVHATVARAPVLGASAQSYNEQELKRQPDILAVLSLPDGVAIVGRRMEAVLSARRSLEVKWTTTAGSEFDSEIGLQRYQADARNLAKKAVVGHKSGEVDAALAAAARIVSSEYTTEYVYHAQLEPLTCVASVTADKVEVWTGTQWPSKAREQAARIAGIAPEHVTVHMQQMGGGFGRRAQVDYVVEAVTLSKALQRPVKLMATREDDVANAHCRPMTAHHLDVGLDTTGKIVAWRHRIAADLVVPQVYGAARLEAQNGLDHIVMAHADLACYDVPTHLAEHVHEHSGVRTGAWRGVGAGPNAFAIEAMIDDLARVNGQDPLAYRLGLLTDNRAKRVVQTVGAMAGWSNKRSDAALGLAFTTLGRCELGESLAAAVVEATLDRNSGTIRIRRIWCAVDVGLPVQPKNIKQQVEGALLWGLSSALIERMSFKAGAVQQRNYYDYQVLRMSATPEVRVEVIRSGDTPFPVGELGLATMMPAISNALVALSGRRLRHAPFTPERVQDALRA